MSKTKTKIEYDVCETCDGGIPAIIVAAGNSTRMNGVNKQFSELCGVPVIARTLMAFENCNAVSRIILVVRAEDIFQLQMLAEKYAISKLSDIICGGKTRQDSVLKGLSRLSAEEDSVLIHDGARPLISDGIITSVANALTKHSAVTCAVRVKDTIKQVDENNKITKTLERSSLFAVQTPQGVRVSDYVAAIEKAGDVSTFTDDMSLMEAAGYDAYCVEGDYKNIKITTPEDIYAAEGYLKEELL